MDKIVCDVDTFGFRIMKWQPQPKVFFSLGLSLLHTCSASLPWDDKVKNVFSSQNIKNNNSEKSAKSPGVGTLLSASRIAGHLTSGIDEKFDGIG